MASKTSPIDSLAANSEWVDRLLELFWVVDNVVAGADDEVPEAILRAYEAAEAARKEL